MFLITGGPPQIVLLFIGEEIYLESHDVLCVIEILLSERFYLKPRFRLEDLGLRPVMAQGHKVCL